MRGGNDWRGANNPQTLSLKASHCSLSDNETRRNKRRFTTFSLQYCNIVLYTGSVGGGSEELREERSDEASGPGDC